MKLNATFVIVKATQTADKKNKETFVVIRCKQLRNKLKEIVYKCSEFEYKYCLMRHRNSGLFNMMRFNKIHLN